MNTITGIDSAAFLANILESWPLSTREVTGIPCSVGGWPVPGRFIFRNGAVISTLRP